MANEMGVLRIHACTIGAIAMAAQTPNQNHGLIRCVSTNKCLTSSPQDSSLGLDSKVCGTTRSWGVDGA